MIITTLQKVYDLIGRKAKIVNKVSKITNEKNRRKMYHIKNESIIDAVEIILETKTKSVEYLIDFDEDKNMNYITFVFKRKEPYMSQTEFCFHLTNITYDKIKSLQENL